MDPPSHITSEQQQALDIAQESQKSPIPSASSHCGCRSCGPALAGRSCSSVDRQAGEQKEEKARAEGRRMFSDTSSPTAVPVTPTIIDVHNNEICKLYRCIKCYLDFDTMFAYQEHLNHTPTHLTCWSCGTVFRDHRVFFAHLTAPCNPNAQALMSRRQSSTMEMAWRIRKTRWLREQVLRVLYLCPLCPMMFSSRIRVQQHLRLYHHTGYRTLACKYCKRQITVKVPMATHESVVCRGCGYVLTQRSA